MVVATVALAERDCAIAPYEPFQDRVRRRSEFSRIRSGFTFCGPQRADMRRLPFQDESFTLVVNLFTSFGYFIEDSQNTHVLRETARVTRPGGYLVLDFLNAPHTRQTIVPFERRQVGSAWVQQRREISEDGRFILKTIMIGTPAKVFSERVRLFEPDDLEAMLADCGFIVTDVCGDYGGGPLTGPSPRAIMSPNCPSAARMREQRFRRPLYTDVGRH
jgi:SAM-dependent methyltransferase